MSDAPREDSASSPGLGARLMDRLRGLFGDRDRTQSGFSARIENAVGVIGQSLARWDKGGMLHRFLLGPEGDLLTAPGEEVAIPATLSAIARLSSERIRFFIGDEKIGEAPIDDEGAFALHRLPSAGRYRIDVEVKGRAGEVLVARGASPARWLHVVDRPLVVVDAASLLFEGGADEDPPPQVQDAIRALPGRGFEVAYFDLAPRERLAEIRRAVDRLKLPAGAVLIHPGLGEEVATLGVDFSTLFVRTAARRFRAGGVPLVALVGGASADRPEMEAEALVHIPLEALPAEVDEPRALARAREAARAMQESRAAAAPLTWRLDQATATRAQEGNRFAYALDNGAARRRLFELIDGAQESIHLQIYIMSEGRFSDELVVHLVRRARAGVRVRLLVDALYSGQNVLGRTSRLVRAMEAEENLEVLATSPIEKAAEIDATRLKNRDHRKILVVDDARALVSGRNAADEYYRGFDEVPIHQQTLHEHVPWLDAHMEIEGPLVGEIQAAFLETWRKQGADAPDPPAEQTRAGSATGRLVVHKGLQDANCMVLYEAMLDGAADHAILVNDFPIVASLAMAIRRALRRGVRVRLLTGCAVTRRADGSFFDGPLHRELFEYMTKERLVPLIREGLQAFEFATPPLENIVAEGALVRPYVHAKLVSVDGRVASIGSANFDATSSYWESEANVVVEDERFAARLETDLEGLIAGSVKIELDSEYWRREAHKRAIAAKLWPDMVYS